MMAKICSKIAGFERTGLAVIVVVAVIIMSPAWPVAAVAGDSVGGVSKDRLGAVFYRSMTHWKYDYSNMPDGKAGVACVPWERLDEAFLDSAIFEALGFSYATASDEVAIRIATQGCEQMKAHYKLTDCACELVLVGETAAVVIPEQAAE